MRRSCFMSVFLMLALLGCNSGNPYKYTEVNQKDGFQNSIRSKNDTFNIYCNKSTKSVQYLDADIDFRYLWSVNNSADSSELVINHLNDSIKIIFDFIDGNVKEKLTINTMNNNGYGTRFYDNRLPSIYYHAVDVPSHRYNPKKLKTKFVIYYSEFGKVDSAWGVPFEKFYAFDDPKSEKTIIQLKPLDMPFISPEIHIDFIHDYPGSSMKDTLIKSSKFIEFSTSDTVLVRYIFRNTLYDEYQGSISPFRLP